MNILLMFITFVFKVLEANRYGKAVVNYNS